MLEDTASPLHLLWDFKQIPSYQFSPLAKSGHSHRKTWMGHNNLIKGFPDGDNWVCQKTALPLPACPPRPLLHLPPQDALTKVNSQLTVTLTLRTSGAATSFKALHSYSPDWSRLMSEISRYSSSLTKPWPSGRKGADRKQSGNRETRDGAHSHLGLGGGGIRSAVERGFKHQGYKTPRRSKMMAFEERVFRLESRINAFLSNSL